MKENFRKVIVVGSVTFTGIKFCVIISLPVPTINIIYLRLYRLLDIGISIVGK